MAAMAAPAVEQAFERHRPFLWGFLYRLTGDAADADDLVQETFVRALRRPPAGGAGSIRPWLVKVALNLGRDHLRRRRRQRYLGPWLPAPLATGEEDEPPAFDPPDPEGGPGARYERLESVSMAFLLALEALTPTQRAVLLLRDVFDYSVRETAAALEVSEANVKTTHLRARRALAAYDRDRRRPTPEARRQAAQVLGRFLSCLAEGDAAGLEALLADGVRALSDGGREFSAARRPVVGRDNVARLLLGLAAKAEGRARPALRTLNGWPAAVVEFTPRRTGFAPRSTLQLELDAAGRVARVYSVLVPRKLAGLAPRSGVWA
jgi:RNA polymerase sigma-70 factor (ECF subfamily)